MNLLVWGIMFIGFAFVFYILINVSVPAGFADFWFIIITDAILHTLWTASPVPHLMGTSNFEKNQNRLMMVFNLGLVRRSTDFTFNLKRGRNNFFFILSILQLLQYG